MQTLTLFGKGRKELCGGEGSFSQKQAFSDPYPATLKYFTPSRCEFRLLQNNTRSLSSLTTLVSNLTNNGICLFSEGVQSATTTNQTAITS